jgi:type I restriction enzyme S subunit
LIKAGKIKRDKKEKTGDTFPYLNVPFEVPESWVWCRLDDICEINPKNSLNDETAVSFIPMTLISDGFANKHLSEIKKWGVVKKGFTHFREGDVGIAKITPCFENRKSIVFQNLVNGFGTGTTELHILRPILEPFLSYYIIWFVKTEDFITNGVNCFTGAVGQQRVGKNVIKETHFPFPPLAEQHRIVSFIESAFALIDQIEENKLSLDQFIKQAKFKVLDLAIYGKLVLQDPTDEPASVLLERICKEQKTKKPIADILHYPFDVPKSWVWTRLGDLCAYGTCNNVTSSEIPNNAWILDLEDIEKETAKLLRRIRKIDRNTTSTRHSFSKGNVLYSKLRTYLNKVLVADMDGFCTTEILPLDFKSFVVPEYARHVLMSKMFLDYTAQCGYGVKMPRLGTTDGQNALFPLPPLSEQKRIIQRIETIFQALDSIQNQGKRTKFK